MGAVMRRSFLLYLWDSPSTANCNCPGHVSSAVSFTVHPHCCQMLDCYGLPYFLLLILPQNLRRRFHSEAARLSPALTLAAASCNGSLSGTGRSFSEAAIRICSRWQLPVKVRAKGRFWTTWTAAFLFIYRTHTGQVEETQLSHPVLLIHIP